MAFLCGINNKDKSKLNKGYKFIVPAAKYKKSRQTEVFGQPINNSNLIRNNMLLSTFKRAATSFQFTTFQNAEM